MSTDADRAATMAWLRAQGDDRACDLIEAAIADAVTQRHLHAVPGLIALMCSFDPHRAGRLRAQLLDACDGRIRPNPLTVSATIGHNSPHDRHVGTPPRTP